MNTHERLEVEDEDERQIRLDHLFKRVDQAREKPLNEPEYSVKLPINLVAGCSNTSPVEQSTDLLDRVRQFLPQLAESNASLSGRDQRELDLENIDDNDASYIEMNLGLGIFKYGRQGDRSDDVSSISASSSSMSEHDTEESDDNSSSGSSSCSEDDAQVAARPKKPLPRRVKQSARVSSGSENLSGGPSL